MVVDTGRSSGTARASQDEQGFDLMFHALADATRRDIVRRAAHCEHSVTTLARSYPMSFAGVQKHVAVLERAGLVTKRRHGREQLVRTDVAALDAARRLLDDLDAVWRERIDRFGDVLADAPEADAPEADAPQADTIRAHENRGERA